MMSILDLVKGVVTPVRSGENDSFQQTAWLLWNDFQGPKLFTDTQIVSRSSLNFLHFTILIFLSVPFAICFRPGSLVRWAIYPVQALLLFQALSSVPAQSAKSTAEIYTQGVLLGNLVARISDRFYLNTPETAFYKKDASGKPEPPPEKLSVVDRFLWGLELMLVTRGIGWNWQVSGIPKSRPQTRASFLLARVAVLVAMYVALHLTAVSCQSILEDFRDVQDDDTRRLLLGVTGNTVFLRCFIVVGWSVCVYSHFAILEIPVSLACVGLGIGPRKWRTVESWAPNFGSFREAYSIRRFWGITWHQQLRRITSSPGSFMLAHSPVWFRRSKALPIRLAKRYFLLLLAFLVSGMVHIVGTVKVAQAAGLQLSAGGELVYFLSQGAAIVVEDFVCYLLKVEDRADTTPGTVRRYVGYASLLVWYMYSFPSLKVVPLAEAHGIRDERGEFYSAVEAVSRAATAIPGNFVAVWMERF